MQCRRRLRVLGWLHSAGLGSVSEYRLSVWFLFSHCVAVGWICASSPCFSTLRYQIPPGCGTQSALSSRLGPQTPPRAASYLRRHCSPLRHSHSAAERALLCNVEHPGPLKGQLALTQPIVHGARWDGSQSCLARPLLSSVALAAHVDIECTCTLSDKIPNLATSPQSSTTRSTSYSCHMLPHE